MRSVVNSAIRPEDDKEHYGVNEFWTVPVDGEGDCEDYVLAKRKMLVLLGLPEPALRITVVLDKGVVRHAVLTVVTDKGDYVLDSLKDDILTADKADYVWVERQDSASRTGWVDDWGRFRADALLVFAAFGQADEVLPSRNSAASLSRPANDR